MRVPSVLRKIALIAALLLTLASLAGCGSRGSEPVGPVPNEPGAQTPPGPTLPGQPRPAVWTGQGLATPYINELGELELAYGDARGTVRVGAGKGKVTKALLAPDRQQLVYVTGEAETERIYYINSSFGQTVERELSEAHDNWPVGRLAWSPCSQYLAVDSGTSAAVRPLLLLKPSTGELIGSCQAFGFAWSPAAPSRLAIAMISNRPLLSATELSRTTDLVVIDLPSGRMTRLAPGYTTEAWGPVEWTPDRGLKVEHTYTDPRKNTSETSYISVPARLPTADAAPAGSGQLPSGVTVRAEIDFRGQLLLVDGQGVVQRKVTDSRDGSVIDASTTADGSLVAYAWLPKGERVTRIKTLRLPDLVQGEVKLDLARVDVGPNGSGPQQVAFAQDHTLLVDYYGLRPYPWVQVYDLDTGKLLVDRDLWMPAWVPGPRTSPLLVAGALLDGSSDPTGSGAELSLVQIDVATGKTTVIRQGSKTESWWPQGFSEPSQLRSLLVKVNASGLPESAEEVQVAIPQ